MSLVDLHHAYGATEVYRGMNFELERGQRLVLVGPNGAGKSTLLKLLAGALPVQKGVRELGLNVKVGYYAQYRVEMLNPNHTVLQAASDLPQPVPEQTIRTVLGSFLFTGDDVFKSVSVLSGGEKSRLALARLLLDPPNLLLMDEPTTHLDMTSIEALIGRMRGFEGTLAFISHDVYFIRQLARQVLHVQDGHLHLYPGDYDYYLDKHTRRCGARAPMAAVAEEAAPCRRDEQGAQAARSRGAAGPVPGERRSASRRSRSWKWRIQELEKTPARAGDRAGRPATYDGRRPARWRSTAN
jgi:ATP-binding cassette subfamily F protein 3